MKQVLSFVLILTLILSLSVSFALSSGAVAVNEVFTFSDPSFGKANPTADGLWMYEWIDRDGDRTVKTMDWSGSNYYEAQYTNAAASDTHWYCRVRTNGNNMHPGAQADSIKTFLCPEAGHVEFHISCKRQNAVSGANNGNSIRLFLNDTKVWPADKDQEELNDTSTVEVKTELDVKKGDKIRFMVGSLGNSSADGVDVSNHYVKYLSGANLTAEQKNYTVACVGDSVTEGMQTTHGLKGSDAYPYQLALLLNATGKAKYTVNNYGRSARTALSTGDYPYTNETDYFSSISCSPDVVLICFGANDSKPSNWNSTQFRKDYTALIKTYQDLPSHPKVYLIYTTYVADQSKTSCNRETIQNTILPLERAIAKDLGIKIIDLNTLTRKNSTKYADGVHPNDALQKMMAEYVFNALCSESVMDLAPADAKAEVKMIDLSEPATTDTSTNTSSSTATVTDTNTVTNTDTNSDPVVSASSENVTTATDTAVYTTDGGQDGGGSSLGLILGIVGGVVVLAAAAFCVWYFVIRKK